MLDARPDLALAAAHVGPEPGHHQGHVVHVRQLGLQLVQRHQDVGPPLGVMHALAGRAGQGLATQHRLGGVDELARAGDQTHALQPLLQPRRRAGRTRTAVDLERQLRRAMAVGLQRQILEHHIGHAAIGWRLAFHGGDQRVGLLVLGPAMHAHREGRGIHHLAVGPDPANPVDGPFSHRHSE